MKFKDLPYIDVEKLEAYIDESKEKHPYWFEGDIEDKVDKELNYMVSCGGKVFPMINFVEEMIIISYLQYKKGLK